MKRKVNTKSIEPLLHKIVDGATGSDMSLEELLRLCMRLGTTLGNSDLVNWARKEASGYPNYKELPDYRVVNTEVRGTFNGFGRSIKNAPIPQMSIDKKHQAFLFKAHIDQPVGELSSIINAAGAESDMLELPWSGNQIAYYQQKEIYQGYVLSYAARIFTRTGMNGILETIRTRVLDLGLKIADELGIDPNVEHKDGEQKTAELESAKLQQIFNTTINAPSNLSVGSSGTTSQKLDVKQGDIQSLRSELERVGLSKQLVLNLEATLLEDKTTTSKPKVATNGWLKQVSDQVKDGSIKLATGITVAMIKAAIQHYTGAKLI